MKDFILIYTVIEKYLYFSITVYMRIALSGDNSIPHGGNYCNLKMQRGGGKLREAWTGEIVAQMHVNEITQGELAKKMCVTRVYLNRLLTGAQVAKGTEERCREAVNQIVAERRAAENAKN